MGCIRQSMINDKNPAWKGDKVGYIALHKWIRKRKIKPEFCEECHKSKSKDLANISGKYLRDINDFRWLCRKCHIHNDGRIKIMSNQLKILAKNRKDKTHEELYGKEKAKEMSINHSKSQKITASKMKRNNLGRFLPSDV